MNRQPLRRVVMPLIGVLALVACGGNSNSSESDRGTYSSRTDNYACPTVHDPVCALAEKDGQHRYQTFSNSCFAWLEYAKVSFNDSCGALEDKPSTATQPVIVHDTVEQLPKASTSLTVIDSEISQNVATLTLQHNGGCAEDRFDLHVAPPFIESWPLQIQARLTHEIEDTCDATLATNTVKIDLQPLKNLYRMTYDSESGEIMIPPVGLYQF